MSEAAVTPRPETGDDEVDAVLASLAGLAEAAQDEQVARLAAAHELLHGILTRSTRPA